MKSNELKELVKKIQFVTDKTLAEIAQDIDNAPAYFTDQVNKGDNPKIRKKLIEKYGELIEQNIRKSGKTFEKTLADLAASDKEISEALKFKAKAHADLVDMLRNSITEHDDAKMNLALEARLSDIWMMLADIGSGKRWKSKEEAVAELNKFVVAPTEVIS